MKEVKVKFILRRLFDSKGPIDLSIELVLYLIKAHFYIWRLSASEKYADSITPSNNIVRLGVDESDFKYI